MSPDREHTKKVLEKLRALMGMPPDPDEPDALVTANIKPRPNRNSGAVSLPEPDESRETLLCSHASGRL